MIKAAKKAIRAILSNADINDEELMTTLVVHWAHIAR